jgi:hypothetical protein
MEQEEELKLAGVTGELREKLHNIVRILYSLVFIFLTQKCFP